jgi:predicted RNase H-like nuclease (RuvC/YqgF family)
MTQDNTDVRVDITPDDVQSVMRSNPMVALQVQNRALMRKLGEVQGEIERLTQELERSQNGQTKKESKNAYSSR